MDIEVKVILFHVEIMLYHWSDQVYDEGSRETVERVCTSGTFLYCPRCFDLDDTRNALYISSIEKKNILPFIMREAGLLVNYVGSTHCWENMSNKSHSIIVQEKRRWDTNSTKTGWDIIIFSNSKSYTWRYRNYQLCWSDITHPRLNVLVSILWCICRGRGKLSW